jgi:peptidoglycan/LPS O-acetylase OafA/YrhL
MLTALIFLGFYEKDGSYGFIYQNNDLYHFALNLGMLQYVGLQTGYAFNAPSWSVSTEFWVNIGFGLMLVWQPRSLARVAGLIVVLSAGILVFVASTWSNGQKMGGWLEINLLRTLCGFFAGVLVHELWRSRPTWSTAGGTAALVFGTGTTLLAAMMFPRTMSGNAYIEMAAALFASTLLVWGCATAPVARVIGDSRLGKWVGEISYSVYMWHFPVAALCVLAGASDAFGRGVLLFATYLGITLGVATMSNKHFERPSRAFLVGMTGSRSRRKLAPS